MQRRAPEDAVGAADKGGPGEVSWSSASPMSALLAGPGLVTPLDAPAAAAAKAVVPPASNDAAVHADSTEQVGS